MSFNIPGEWRKDIFSISFFMKMKNICIERNKGNPGKCRETTKEEIGNGI